jgi:hypothetical protein
LGCGGRGDEEGEEGAHGEEVVSWPFTSTSEQSASARIAPKMPRQPRRGADRGTSRAGDDARGGASSLARRLRRYSRDAAASL